MPDGRKAVEQRARRELVRRMRVAALGVEGNVKRLLSVGQPVRRTPSGRLVGLDPSPPGKPPHTLTGRLRNSITHEVVVQGDRIVARIGTNVEYARRLEYGFMGTDALGRNVHQPARPYLRPGLKLSEPFIRRAFK